MHSEIPFNRTHLFGIESQFVQEVIGSGNLGGNGDYTKKCHQFFRDYYRVEHCLLTNSCTAALEMAAILLDIKAGDEVIVPAYGYVSTANAFALRGAKLVFADSMEHSPNLDVGLLEDIITQATKAIVVMHYGGVAVDMDVVMALSKKHNIFIVEDAAHGIDAYYKDKPLGTIGHLGALSFHSSKNITSGHGGLLMVNDPDFVDRSNVIWQKGTDKSKFDLGHQEYYQWVDIGSSFFPSELTAAYLYGQLLNLESITNKRIELWDYYNDSLKQLNKINLPSIPNFARHNAHIFYLKFENKEDRYELEVALINNKISAFSHYLNLSNSPFSDVHDVLASASDWEKCLLRLPFFYELSLDQIDRIVDVVKTVAKE